MTKQYFWPLTMIVLGAIMTGTMFGYLPLYLLWFWPVVMLIVGLGALVVADRPDWIVHVEAENRKSRPAKLKR